MNYVNIKIMLFLCIGMQKFFGSNQMASLTSRPEISPLIIKGMTIGRRGLTSEKYQLLKLQVGRYHDNFLRMIRLTQAGTKKHERAESDYQQAKKQIEIVLEKYKIYIGTDSKAFFSNPAQTGVRRYKEEAEDSEHCYVIDTFQAAESALSISDESKKTKLIMFMKGLIEKHEVIGKLRNAALSVGFGSRISFFTPEDIVLFCKGTEADLQKKLPKQDTSKIHTIKYDNGYDESTSQLSGYESVSNHLRQLPLKYRFQEIRLIPREESNFAAQHFMRLQNRDAFKGFTNAYESYMVPIIISVYSIALAVTEKPELSIKPYIPSMVGLSTLGLVSKNTSSIWPLLSIVGSCGLAVHPLKSDLKRWDLYKRNCRAFQEIHSLMEDAIKDHKTMLYLANLKRISTDIAEIVQRHQLTIQLRQDE